MSDIKQNSLISQKEFPLSKEEFNTIIQCKNLNIRRKKWTLTPNLTDDVWNEGILELQDDGVPKASFFDTKDKLVILPSHVDRNSMTDEDNYAWSDDPLVDDDVLVSKIDRTLFNVGSMLTHLGYTVVFASFTGCDKGFLITSFTQIKPQTFFAECDINCVSVLFVYTTDDKLKTL
jgi:hypothetical protein